MPRPRSQQRVPLGMVAAVGSVVNSLQWMANKAGTALATLLLAHWLAPDDFGVAGQASALVQFIACAVPLTLGDVLVSHADQVNALGPAASRLSLRLGILNFILVALAVPACIQLYREFPAGWLAGLLLVLGMRPFFESLQTVPLSRLRIGLRYRRIALIDGVSQLAGTIFSIALAALGAGAAALAAPMVLAGALRAWWYRGSVSEPQSEQPVPGASRLLLHDYLPAAGAQYLHKVASTLELLVLGLVAGPAETGMLAFGALLASQANTVIAYQLGVALQPIFGRLATDQGRQADGLVRTQRALGMVCVPIALAQATFAEPAFRSLFAARYQPAIPAFQALSLVQAVVFSLGPSIACLYSQRRFRTFLVWQSVELVVGTGTCWLGAGYWGAVGAAVGHGVVWAVSVPVLLALALGSSSRVALRAIASVFIAPLLICAPIFALGAWASKTWLAPLSHGDLLSILLVLPACLGSAWLIAFAINHDLQAAARWFVRQIRGKRRMGYDSDSGFGEPLADQAERR
jgi:O-antigen/teichoic acid export membrane protein